MRLFNKVTIIGVGLIGGSIGLAIKKKGLAGEVTGVFRKKATRAKALKFKAVDNGVMSVKDGVAGADLIILATPVFSIPHLAAEAARYAKPGAIITDAGSTKQWIVSRVEGILKKRRGVAFVGSHPMAGSESSGVRFAKAGLFNGSPCIVVKTARTDKRALKKVAAFWKALGAKTHVMNPRDHDRGVSLVSHLPHVVAFALAGAVDTKYLSLAAEGFKDTTRVASSDPHLWADILFTNKEEVVAGAKAFENYYKNIVKAVSKKDYGKLASLLGAAKAKRDRFQHER